MNQEKLIAELTARVQELEAMVETLSAKKTAKKDAPAEKRCLPGFNTCEVGQTKAADLPDENADEKEGRCLPGYNSCDETTQTRARHLPDENAEDKEGRCLPGFNSCNIK